MLVNALDAKGYQPIEFSDHWADGVYNFANQQNYPTSGFNDVKKRSNPINRQMVAEIIAGADGVNYVGTNAIQYLLGKGLANGKVPG